MPPETEREGGREERGRKREGGRERKVESVKAVDRERQRVREGERERYSANDTSLLKGY